MTKQPLSLTSLQQEHREALHDMLRESWRETCTPEPDDRITGQLLDTLSSKDIGGLVPGLVENVFVAIHEGRIMGRDVSASRNRVIYIWGFYVRK